LFLDYAYDQRNYRQHITPKLIVDDTKFLYKSNKISCFLNLEVTDVSPWYAENKLFSNCF